MRKHVIAMLSLSLLFSSASLFAAGAGYGYPERRAERREENL